MTFLKSIPTLVILIPFLHLNKGSHAELIQAGKVISAVTCHMDSTQTYALYLPSGYFENDEDEFPVIYAFDAAARGAVAVELFSQAAEKFGFIVAGSNVSENGPWEPILKAAETMMKDVEQRFRVDHTRRYTAGFSGGARVATTLAVLYGTFEGVIGCGAGFSPNYPPHFDLQFSYIGLIGNKDFNYLEMIRLDDRLTQLKIDHYIYEFSGGHEWPPAEVLTNAVTWLQFKAMKNDVIWTDYNLREEFYEERLNLINSFLKQDLKYAAYKEALELKSYLDGVRRTEEVDQIIRRLQTDPDVRAQQSEIRDILDQERTYYKEYLDAFASYRKNHEDGMTQTATMTYWKQQLKIARHKMDHGRSMSENLLGNRMIEFLWRTAYQQYESVQGTEFQSVSRYYLEIWALVQPEAISPYFFLSRYYTEAGKHTKALEYLNKAIDKGLDDPALIERDSTLVRLTGLAEYENIIRRIGQ